MLKKEASHRGGKYKKRVEQKERERERERERIMTTERKRGCNDPCIERLGSPTGILARMVHWLQTC